MTPHEIIPAEMKIGQLYPDSSNLSAYILSLRTVPMIAAIPIHSGHHSAHFFNDNLTQPPGLTLNLLLLILYCFT
jgi:hypothetical protein